MTLDPADSVRTSGEEFSRDDGTVLGRTAMSRRLLFRYILIFSSFFAEIRPVLPSISEKVSIPLSPDSASFLSRHSKALPRH
jgi:hypothetical protein